MKRMNLWGRLICAVLPLSMTLCMTACGEQAAALPDLSSMGEIVAVAREEGSGTWSEFERLIGSSESGTDQIALSTEEVLEQVVLNENAVGYLALSAAENSDTVKLLAVDGIMPNAETVKNGEYPLCRNYYIAYTGEMNEVETDFMSYLLSAGQELVGQSCIPVKKATSFLSNGSAGTIIICGSSSVAPLMEQLAEDYKSYNPNAAICIETSDSSSGLTSAIRRECDFAMSSRTLKDYEEELLEARTIALDGIAVAVNASNPLESLTSKQLKEIYDGTVLQWDDLRK